jgi:hypothetical protein
MRARAFTILGALFCGAGLAIAHTVPIIFFHGGAPDELNPQQWLITP